MAGTKMQLKKLFKKNDKMQYEMKIEKIKQESKDSKSFILIPIDFSQGLFDYKPGQFFLLESEISRPKDLKFSNEKNKMIGSEKKENVLVKKAFSCVSSPKEDFIELLVKSEGGNFAPFFLEQAKVGDTCKLGKPSGFFMKNIFENNEKQIACWSVGSGIPSTISLMRYVLENDLNKKIVVFDSNKTVDDIIFHEEIKELVNKSENFSVVFTLTREQEIPNSKEKIFYEKGRFFTSENTLKKYTGENWKNFFNTICGSSSFINGLKRNEKGIPTKIDKGIEDILIELGIKKEKIDKDQYYLQ